MDGHEIRKQQKMKLIKQSTIELCNKYATKKVTIDEIAQKANVSKVTIYNYFNSKEELISTIFEEIYNSIIENTKKMVCSEGDFLDKINLIVESKIKSLSFFNSDFHEELFFNSNSKAYNAFEESIKKLMFSFFDEGKKQGYIDEEIDNETLYMFSETFNAGLQRVFVKNINFFSSPESLSQLIDVYFHGMIKENKNE